MRYHKLASTAGGERYIAGNRVRRERESDRERERERKRELPNKPSHRGKESSLFLLCTSVILVELKVFREGVSKNDYTGVKH